MRTAFIALLIALVGRSAPAQVQPSEAAAVPVFQEPRHHLVYENALVRVLDVRVAPGETTGYHVHANRHIAVVISGARTWEQFSGQAPSAVESVADSIGTVFDNASASLPYTHRVGNADTMPFRYVVAQLLAPAEIVSPALPASSGLRLDRDTLGARIYRVTVAPGQSHTETQACTARFDSASNSRDTPPRGHRARGRKQRIRRRSVVVAKGRHQARAAGTSARRRWRSSRSIGLDPVAPRNRSARRATVRRAIARVLRALYLIRLHPARASSRIPPNGPPRNPSAISW